MCNLKPYTKYWANKNALLAAALLLVIPVLQSCMVMPRFIQHRDALSPEEYVQLGTSFQGQGLKEDARRQYENALKLQGEYVPALMAMGNLSFESGDKQTAEIFYQRVLRVEAKHAGANNNMAMVVLSRGTDLDKAEEFIRTALNEDTPLRPYILDTLASLYIKQGRYPEARNTLNQADAIASPDDTALRAQLAESRRKLLP